MDKTYWVLVIFLIGSILEMLRRKLLREKYAIVWLVMAFFVVISASTPHLLNNLSNLLGFQVFSNFILLMFGLVNLFIIMQLSVSISRTENQIQSLAEELALLKSSQSQTEL